VPPQAADPSGCAAITPAPVVSLRLSFPLLTSQYRGRLGPGPGDAPRSARRLMPRRLRPRLPRPGATGRRSLAPCRANPHAGTDRAAARLGGRGAGLTRTRSSAPITCIMINAAAASRHSTQGRSPDFKSLVRVPVSSINFSESKAVRVCMRT
jgi:hypothetical protein